MVRVQSEGYCMDIVCNEGTYVKYMLDNLKLKYFIHFCPSFEDSFKKTANTLIVLIITIHCEV